MGAAADQLLGPQQAPCQLGRQVVLAQMHAVGVHRQGQIDAVIDEEQRSMAPAQRSQGLRFGQAAAVVGLLGAVLHQAHPRLQRCLHHTLKIGQRAGDQIQPAGLQALPQGPCGRLFRLRCRPSLRRRARSSGGPQQLHLQVVEAVADGRRLTRQLGILKAAELLQHPQCLLHPAGVGRQHLGGRLALQLGRMAEAGAAIPGGVTLQLVAGVMQTSETLTQVLAGGHQIGALQGEAAPVLQHPQALAGTIEIGVEQASDRSDVGIASGCRCAL